MTNKKYEMIFDGSHKFVTKDVIFKQPINLNVLNISLEDYNGENMDLNGIPFSFTLEITTIHNSLLKNYLQSTFYSPDLVKMMLDDMMLSYFTDKTKNYKIGEEYDKMMRYNVKNHDIHEDNEIDNQINIINETDNDDFILMDVEEKDRINYEEKKKKMLKFIKKFKSKYPDKYNEIKGDKKNFVK